MPEHTYISMWKHRNLGFGIFLTIFLLCLLYISFIPVKYTATAIIETKKSSTYITPPYLIEHVEDDIRSKKILLHVARTYNLQDRHEFNISQDKNRAKLLRIYDYLTNRIKVEQQTPLKERIVSQMRLEITLKEVKENVIQINYTSSSPHLARALANTIAQKYIELENPKVTKEIIQLSELPKNISSPNVISYLYCSALISFVFSVSTLLLIRLPKNADKNG